MKAKKFIIIGVVVLVIIIILVLVIKSSRKAKDRSKKISDTASWLKDNPDSEWSKLIKQKAAAKGVDWESLILDEVTFTVDNG